MDDRRYLDRLVLVRIKRDEREFSGESEIVEKMNSTE